MQRAAQKTTAVMATAVVIGFSSLFGVASPARANPIACSNGGTLIDPSAGICELRVPAPGGSTFTPSAEMSQLEALLVAGGGFGGGGQGVGGYGAGGGGEVRVVGFADTATPLTVIVGGAASTSRVTQGAISEAARPGQGGGSPNIGGTSGNLMGPWGPVGGGASGGSGAGAGASPIDAYTGGAGVTVASVAPSGSLFSGVSDCYGGGGAFAIDGGAVGTASCGGGYFVQDGSTLTAFAPGANTGGGSGGTLAHSGAGASGLVVLRWLVETVTVSFADNGHGGAVAPQRFVKGGTATPPTPSAAGYTFNGWFTDAALTTPVDFTAPVTASTTFYASWSAVAPATVTVTFDNGGHGGTVAPQSFASGGTPAEPTDPTASGFIFNGWFTDAALTTPVDFAAPVTASTTFYASWSAVPTPSPTPTPTTPTPTTPAPSVTADAALAKTGAAIDPSAASLALAALGMGAGLLALRARRARRAQ